MPEILAVKIMDYCSGDKGVFRKTKQCTQQLLLPSTLTSPDPELRFFMMTCCAREDPRALPSTC